MNELARTTISSMEVGKMIGKEHHKLLRDLRNYVSQLGESKINLYYRAEQNNAMFPGNEERL